MKKVFLKVSVLIERVPSTLYCPFATLQTQLFGRSKLFANVNRWWIGRAAMKKVRTTNTCILISSSVGLSASNHCCLFFLCNQAHGATTSTAILESSSLGAQSSTWSNYKHCNTGKFVIGCTSNGAILYISQCMLGQYQMSS